MSLNPVLRIDWQFENVVKAHWFIDCKAAYALVHERLLQVGICDFDWVFNGFVYEFSGGMVQRVVIAIAMLLNPRIIIVDEPMTAFDLMVQCQIMDLLCGLMEIEGCSVLLVTHDLGVVVQYCDCVAVMFVGCVLESGLIREVFRRFVHFYMVFLIVFALTASWLFVLFMSGYGMFDLIDYLGGCLYWFCCAFAVDICEHAWPVLILCGVDVHVSCYWSNDHGFDATEVILYGAARG